jgi:DNA-binding LytR/AlgR family response regulator
VFKQNCASALSRKASKQRFAEAVEELARTHGYRLHRSSWASANAIESVRWKRGGGEVLLTGRVPAPVSRSCATALKEAGWR